MKLLFSEYPAQYSNYQFPYQVWAVEESNNERDALLAQGFLPTRFKIGLWYLARSCRVNLPNFEESSENRRIVKNTEQFASTVTHAKEFALEPEHFALIHTFCNEVIGTDFSESSIKRIFSSHLCSKVIEWHDADRLVGVSPVLETNEAIFYWYGFLDPAYSKSGLGMRMMLEAVMQAKEAGKQFGYVGTIYTKSSLYKTNLKGFEFFNGLGWSDNEDELKYLLEKDTHHESPELFKDAEYLKRFHNAQHIGDIIKNKH